jgi:hypothetical protein
MPMRRGNGLRSFAAVLAASGLAMPGCIWLRPSLPLELHSLDQSPVVLRLDLPHGGYAVHPSETSIILSDHPIESLLESAPRTGQILHAQVLWVPKPGTTPVAPTATNVTLRWAVFSEGEVGVYGGAGFCWPRGQSGRDPIRIDIDGSTLSLIASTDGFVDLVSPAEITGSLRAEYAPSDALRLRQVASQLVTDALGRTFWVAVPASRVPPTFDSTFGGRGGDPLDRLADLRIDGFPPRFIAAADHHPVSFGGGEAEHRGLEPR